jgi:ABC-type uncharacterized transport system substrate-binding protein
MAPVVQGLRDLGYIEGQNIAFEFRHASAKYEILPNLAAELVSLQPDVILAAQAVKGATGTIPIVFTRVSDPIGVGLVHALARPRGKSDCGNSRCERNRGQTAGVSDHGRSERPARRAPMNPGSY